MVGDEPVPGYTLVEDLGGSAFYKMWRVKAPDGSAKIWKVVDLVVGNAAIETRTLGLLIQLRHQHLNTLTNFWQVDDGKTLIIESDVPASSLRERLEECKKSGGGLPREELLTYIDQAAEGLDFLNSPRHEFQGSKVAIYHRALRPECLLLFPGPGGMSCKVSDFGLSKPVTDEVAQHSQGLLHYDYDPPEFFEGQTSPTSDQYALAINYFELRTGQLPFSGTMLQQLQARLNDAPNLSALEEPERSIVRKALSRDPRNRYASCTAFAEQLRRNEAPAGVAATAESAQRRPATSPNGSASTRGVGASVSRPRVPGARPTPAPASHAPTTLPRSSDSGNGTGLPPIDTAMRTEPSPIRYNPPPPMPSEDSPARPRFAAEEPARASAATLPPPAAPARPARPAPPAQVNVRDLRKQISPTSLAEAFAGRSDDQKIPIVWVGVILTVTLGLVYLLLSFFTPSA